MVSVRVQVRDDPGWPCPAFGRLKRRNGLGGADLRPNFTFSLPDYYGTGPFFLCDMQAHCRHPSTLMRAETGDGEKVWNAPQTRLEPATEPRWGRVVCGDPWNVTNRSMPVIRCDVTKALEIRWGLKLPFVGPYSALRG